LTDKQNLITDAARQKSVPLQNRETNEETVAAAAKDDDGGGGGFR
jgi:hypothetical protein